MIAADVTHEEAVAGYAAATLEHHGRIDFFSNNAGIEGPVAPIIDYSFEDFQRVQQVNVAGVFQGLKHVLLATIRQQSGSIVITSSVAGPKGTAGMIGYNASKRAVIGMMRCAVVEYAKYNVRMNCVNLALCRVACWTRSTPLAAATRK